MARAVTPAIPIKIYNFLGSQSVDLPLTLCFPCLLAFFGAAFLQHIFLVSFSFNFVKACKSSHSFRMQTTNNSLSTMSSPVTASLHSSCSSTLAASPPSRPVSLPDNKTLAQAISMAPTESLPSLLSSYQDSSGGNTNMALTSGPLNSPSNSTQSPTSSSSGTPCSTSQFSSTLVVPSYISTYSPFSGLSVVSTLPATSTNMPVAVGGSCGGAMRSVSSTFPSLNKAFVVGPGYAPVPYKLVSTITAGLLEDLADILPDNIQAQEIEPPAILEGKLVITSLRNHGSTKKQACISLKSPFGLKWGLMVGLLGFASHRGSILSRSWLGTVQAPGYPRHPPFT